MSRSGIQDRWIREAKRPVCRAYFHAKETVRDNGFARELDRCRETASRVPSSSRFVRESAWVILNSGFRESTVAGLFDLVSEAFFEWRSAGEIVRHRETCVERARQVFNHPGKLRAIVEIAEHIAATGVVKLYHACVEEIAVLQQYPYIGPVSQYHLAKNIGLPVAKPDRHLRRISALFGYSSVQRLCSEISEIVGDPIPVVDTVLWRYATLERDYIEVMECVSRRTSEEEQLCTSVE